MFLQFLYGRKFRSADAGNEGSQPTTPTPTPTQSEPAPTPVATQSGQAPQPITINVTQPAPTPSVPTPAPTQPDPTPVATPEPTPVQAPKVDNKLLFETLKVPALLQPAMNGWDANQVLTYVNSEEYKGFLSALNPTPPVPTQSEPAPKPDAKGSTPPSGTTNPEPTLPKTFKDISTDHFNMFGAAFTREI